MAKGKKTGGRRPGSQNRVTRDVRELAQSLFDADYWQGLKAKLVAGTLNPMIEKTLLAYAYGEPKKTLSIDGEISVQAKRTVLHRLPIEVVQAIATQADDDDAGAVLH